MSENSPLYMGGLSGTYVVWTRAGKMVRCHVEQFGGVHHPKELRWVFEDENCTHNAAPFWPLETMDELGRIVEQWNESRTGSDRLPR